MEKNTFLKISSIVLYFVALLIIVYALGFLESGNIVKGIFIGVGLSCSIFADKVWKRTKS